MFVHVKNYFPSTTLTYKLRTTSVFVIEIFCNKDFKFSANGVELGLENKQTIFKQS